MRNSLKLFCTAAMIWYAFPALAQESGPAEGDGLQEIVVTAQKREQSLQSVPVAVTACVIGPRVTVAV